MTPETLFHQIKISSPTGLSTALKAVAQEYAKRFCEAYDYRYGWFVGDDYAGTFCTDGIEVSLSLSDIVYCVDNAVPKEVFNKWWEYVLAEADPKINIQSWSKGFNPKAK